MAGTFDDLNFLMGSNNRIQVLKAIAREPHTQEELVESTGTSTITVGRILDDFLDRRWIEGRNDRYTTTILGSAVAGDTATLERTVDVARRFRPVGEYFSGDELDFDPRLLADAEMSRSPDDSAFDHVDRWAELFRATTDIRAMASSVPATLLDVLVQQIRAGEMTLSAVLTGDFVDRLSSDGEKRQAIRELLAVGANLYRCDDADWDFAVGVYDAERMSIAGFDDVGTPRVKIESHAAPLRDWAESKIQSFRDRSVPISVDGFDE